ncbi:MAG: carboxypeptidase-like regulatory domain-containing protein, partial [Planctomycetaceae bacterium]|nr:carboxypeptidase-like regulatory domain-containing protein [Planctomycetaceae bacterium]
MNYCKIKEFFALIFSVLIAGCSEGLPDNFPSKLTNVTIKLLYEGKPVEGASISLISESTSDGYLVTAFTASDGTARLETSVNKFSKLGVPAGTYKAIISHVPKTSIELTQQEVMTLGNDALKKREDEVNKERAKLPHPVPESW